MSRHPDNITTTQHAQLEVEQEIYGKTFCHELQIDQNKLFTLEITTGCNGIRGS
jgi:hypothetical protein